MESGAQPAGGAAAGDGQEESKDAVMEDSKEEPFVEVSANNLLQLLEELMTW